MPNLTNIDRLADWLKTEGEAHFAMHSVAHGCKNDNLVNLAACGSVCCMMGACEWLRTGNPVVDSSAGGRIDKSATEWLGVTYIDTEPLFNPNSFHRLGRDLPRETQITAALEQLEKLKSGKRVYYSWLLTAAEETNND